MKYDSIVRRLLFKLPPEIAHEIGIKALKLGVGGSAAKPAEWERFGPIERFGLSFPNPIGLAAGFDKNGVVVNQLASLGFGFVEVGTVTYEPQPGNPRPRLFRLPEDEALINRLGFNNDGAAAIAERLRATERRCIVGVNIGRNKNTPNEEATENYLRSFELVHPVADYVVINVSSPNTPDLRDLQQSASLDTLLAALQDRNLGLSSDLRLRNAAEVPAKAGTQNDGPPGSVPLLVKIAPDLTDGEIEAIVDVCLSSDIAGIIATNTTISRAGLKTSQIENFGSGGLSGRPLRDRSTEVIAAIYRYSKGKLPIIGVGGIFTAEDAFAKIAAGASLLQAYTGFIYGGPSFARDVNQGLAKILQEKGFTSLDEAVGSA